MEYILKNIRTDLYFVNNGEFTKNIDDARIFLYFHTMYPYELVSYKKEKLILLKKSRKEKLKKLHEL